MNLFDLPFNLADLPFIGTLVGLLLWCIAAALALLVVEAAIFLWLTFRPMRRTHHGKAATGRT
jgi:hypothetical protein